MQSNYPCKECSHEFGAHEIDMGWNRGCKRCISLERLGMAKEFPSWSYHKFVPDNLAYLELKYEASTEEVPPTQG